MLIDMHNHTKVSSGCSIMEPKDLIEAARAAGLDAVCVTEHFLLEGATVTQALGRKLGFPVFRGVEARSAMGDMLVYGYHKDIPEGISLDDLCWYVHEAGGVVFAAHPYHTTGGWNLYAAMQASGLDLDADWDKLPVLRELDGIETVNGNVADENNAKAAALAAGLGVPGIGGSDAHATHMVGRAATEFGRPIWTEADLVAALKAGAYRAVRLR